VTAQEEPLDAHSSGAPRRRHRGRVDGLGTGEESSSGGDGSAAHTLSGAGGSRGAAGAAPGDVPVDLRRGADHEAPPGPRVVHVPDTVSLFEAARSGAAGVLGLLLPAVDFAAAEEEGEGTRPEEARAEEGVAEGRDRTLQLVQVLAASEGRAAFLQVCGPYCHHFWSGHLIRNQ
jgi:hypothetical protein